MIVITSDRDTRLAVSAIRAGAFDVIVRPLVAADVRDSVLRAIATAPEGQHGDAGGDLAALIGASAPMDRLRTTILQVSRSDAPVLVLSITDFDAQKQSKVS